MKVNRVRGEPIHVIDQDMMEVDELGRLVDSRGVTETTMTFRTSKTRGELPNKM